MNASAIFTSSSVTSGHPDKLCDQISDAVVDAYLDADDNARVIAEAAMARGILFLAVRGSPVDGVDVAAVARQVIAEAGYTSEREPFSAGRCTITTSLSDIAPAPDDEAAPDDPVSEQQATLFGYACDETPAYLPAPLWIAHRVARVLEAARRDGLVPMLAPDGQVQAAVVYDGGEAKALHALTEVTATRSDAGAELEELRQAVRDAVVLPALADCPLPRSSDARILVNPAGLVVGGGPDLHAGLTGRKTAIDTYGEVARHSGAALSGKSPDRIDRSAAYAARFAARNIVAAGLARRCEVFLSYDVGRAEPVGVGVETFGTGRENEDSIVRRLIRAMDFRPGAIRRRFRLGQLPSAHAGIFYRRLAAYGQMGRDDLEPPWERTDLLDDLS